MNLENVQKFKELNVDDYIYMMTIDDVRKLRILEISEVKYTSSPSDYYITGLDTPNDTKYLVLVKGDEVVEYVDDKVFVSDSFYQSILWYNLQSVKFEKECINKETNN